jgi:carboxypeptidase PM20D1
MRRILLAATVLALLGSSAHAQAPDVKAEARAMFARIIAFPTVEGRGEVPALAEYLAGQLKSAGFPAEDIQIQRLGETATLTVRYRGAAKSKKPPVIFMAHMDVVPASQQDWGRDPFTLTEQDGLLYGRGVVDNKYGVLTITQTFMRLKREGFVPDRDLILAFSGDEETSGKTAMMLAPQLKGAAYAINSDAGGGFRASGGGGASYAIQVAEKTYATFEITARNSGGHSSAPRPDNAIYELSDGLHRLAGYRFAARWNKVTLAAMAQMAPTVEGELGAAMKAFVAHPGDPAALKTLEGDPGLSNEMRTTCVATMLRGGHAENALPVSATATVNCRIFPGQTVAEVKDILAGVLADPALAIAVIGDPLESGFSEPPAEVDAALAKVLAVRAPGARVIPYMEAGATDGLYYRAAGIPTLGAGPVFSTDGFDYNYHGNNERLPLAQFNEGLDHYYLFIKALAGHQSSSFSRSSGEGGPAERGRMRAAPA